MTPKPVDLEALVKGTNQDLQRDAPAMIEELRELRASRVPPEREELLLAAMDAATARAERDAMRAEVEGLKAFRDSAERVIRDAWWRLKNPTMGGEYIRNARDVLDDFRWSLRPSEAPEDADYQIEKQLEDAKKEADSLRAQLATAHDALRLFEEGRKLFVDGLDDRAQDRFEQAADAMKKTKGGGT